jgi:hypothetical protein
MFPSSPLLTRFALVLGFLAAPSLLSAQSPEQDSPETKGSFARCTPDEFTLCFNEGRFRVNADFQLTPTGFSQHAHAVPLTDQTGEFWFFDPTNVELIVKVLNACTAPFNHYWVFSAGLTNVGVVVTVVDLATGASQHYTNLIGTPYLPIQDTSAFSTCP